MVDVNDDQRGDPALPSFPSLAKKFAGLKLLATKTSTIVPGQRHGQRSRSQ